MEAVFQLLALSALGALTGCVTGLLPSLHVNTLAVILIAAAPGLEAALLAAGFDAFAGPFCVAALILSISIAHTFVNIIPATYLGAPDESTVLAVLPGHKLLLRGTGFRAVQLSALASQAAVLASLVLLVPFKWLLGAPIHLFEFVRNHLLLLVLGLAIYLVASEPGECGPADWSPTQRRRLAKALALALLLVTGVYGLLLNGLPYASQVPVPPSPLLPALTGLFGAATLLAAFGTPAIIPHQFLRIRHRDVRLVGGAAALSAGLVAGATMSVLPGLTNASATALATTLRKGTNEETIVSLSAVNTANAMFNLAMLYLYLRTRSGAVVAMEQLWPVRTWHDVLPADLAWFGFVALVTGLGSMLLTLLLGRVAVRRLQRIPYRGLLAVVLVYMTLVVWLFTGSAGLLVYATGALLGLLPIRLGLRRVALTGVLLGPLLVYVGPGAGLF